MNEKKDLKLDRAPATSQAKSMTAGTSTGSPPASSYSAARSQPQKSVEDSMKELASLYFQIKRAESSGKSLNPAQTERAKELINDLKAADVKFHGIISKCWISGNDCHLLNADLEIMQHFSHGQNVPEGFEKARRLIPSMPDQAIGLMVYSHQIQYLYLDGTTQVVEI